MLTPLRADALGDLRHGFFTRQGGVSTGLYDSLNGGRGSSDDPAAVAENRARIAQHLGVETLLSLHQIHSATVLPVTGPWPLTDGVDVPPKADAMVTATPGIGLSALAADCAPVLLADRQAGVIGAAHSGWKGAIGGVLEATVEAMRALGARDITAIVGPCISQAAYEVGPEFVEQFIDEDAGHARFFAGGAGDRAQFDLPGFALSRLRAAGAEAEWIGHCTYGDPARFYSYRRSCHLDEPDYGRLVAAITL